MTALLQVPSTPSSACPTPPPPPQVAATLFFAINPNQPIVEGLSLLQSGGAEERRQLLGAVSFTTAMATSGTAQLWACCMEVAERPVTDVAAVAQAVVAACSAVAAMLFFLSPPPSGSEAARIVSRADVWVQCQCSARGGRGGVSITPSPSTGAKSEFGCSVCVEELLRGIYKRPYNEALLCRNCVNSAVNGHLKQSTTRSKTRFWLVAMSERAL